MRFFAAFFSCWLLAASAWAGGFVTTADFVVRTASDNGQTADQSFAQEVAVRATEFRREIAREWLGTQIPSGVGRTYLTVMISDRNDMGRTWAKNELTGEYHNVHLTTSRTGALGGTLAHEIAHVVLSTRYPPPQSLPPWATEGIASRYDEQSRVLRRQEILRWYGQTGNWPDLETILDYRSIPAKERATYAVAVSLCEFLLTRGDKRQLLEFAADGPRLGWDRALANSYNMDGVQQLQVLWEAWAASQLSVDSSPSDAS